MISDDPELNALVDRALALFNKLTPEEQAAHRREQAIDFVLGNLRLSGRTVTEQQIADVYDELHAPSSDVVPKQSG